jgi:hypothetical protein
MLRNYATSGAGASCSGPSVSGSMRGWGAKPEVPRRPSPRPTSQPKARRSRPDERGGSTASTRAGTEPRAIGSADPRRCDPGRLLCWSPRPPPRSMD